MHGWVPWRWPASPSSLHRPCGAISEAPIKPPGVARHVEIDPWGSAQVTDYARLRDEFGIEPFGPDDWGTFTDPHLLFRRGVVFGHRDFARVRDAVSGHDPWAVMTGLMPSGPMHLGHKMVMDQCIAHQGAGADVHIAVADIEASAARGLSLEKAREIAVREYISNYLALGLEAGPSEVYFQSRRRLVRDLADQFGRKVNLSQMQALYGFGGSTTLAHVMAPLVQAADILHVQDESLGGPRPVLVPVGVDQDPHLRLTRDVAQSWRTYNVQATKDGGVGVYVKPDDDVGAHLDAAEAVLGELGYGDWKRNDGYKELRSAAGRNRDIRAIDLALARIEQAGGGLGFIRPAATFHRFMTGLQGGKMSSSKPETGIFLNEDPAEAEKKLKRSVTGGRATADEQRMHGADPEKCPVYELYLYHLAQDDAHLQTVHDECRGGERLCGGCKGEAIGLLKEFLDGHKERRDQTAHAVDDIISEA